MDPTDSGIISATSTPGLRRWGSAAMSSWWYTIGARRWGSGGRNGMLSASGRFIEYLLPLRNISGEAMDVYRRHYRNPGPSRQPILAWTRELAIEGQPEDVTKVVDSYGRWLSSSTIPKLFVDADPAGFLIGAQRDFCRAWPNRETVTVKGAHFLMEESPAEVGEAITRFVSKVLARQIS
jgi:haloalkane dehalogenase